MTNCRQTNSSLPPVPPLHPQAYFQREQEAWKSAPPCGIRTHYPRNSSPMLYHYRPPVTDITIIVVKNFFPPSRGASPRQSTWVTRPVPKPQIKGFLLFLTVTKTVLKSSLKFEYKLGCKKLVSVNRCQRRPKKKLVIGTLYWNPYSLNSKKLQKAGSFWQKYTHPNLKNQNDLV